MHSIEPSTASPESSVAPLCLLIISSNPSGPSVKRHVQLRRRGLHAFQELPAEEPSLAVLVSTFSKCRFAGIMSVIHHGAGDTVEQFKNTYGYQGLR